MGCGACKYACANEAITLIDFPERGIRPNVNGSKCQRCGECVKVCPGIELSHQSFNSNTIPELRQAWGPVLELWEGYASDPEIRFEASSGGAATALALFCLEKEHISGVLHISASPEAPLRNVPVFSRNRADLLACTGSRYSPAAPCQRFDWIESADCGCVFIGKPCDVVALRKSQALNPELNEKVGLAISIFCAGTPSTKGTYYLLEALGVEPDQVKSLRYRGCGWPGETVVEIKGSNNQRRMTYEQSWSNILSNYGQFRCRLCPDSTGEFADIACGDPWYRKIEPDDPGWSLVLVRTERGREILQKAMNAGYVKLERVGASIVPRSQKALLRRRCRIWGRLLTMRIMRIPVPRYTGFSLFENWLRVPATEKLHSFGGTLKRIMLRGWMKPLKSGIPGNGFQKANGVGKPTLNFEEDESQWKA